MEQDGSGGRKPAVPSHSFKSHPFFPKRLSEAEKLAAKVYKHEAPKDPKNPPLIRRAHPWNLPPYSAIANPMRADNMVALNQEQGTLKGFLEQNSTQASIAGSGLPTSEIATETESDLWKPSDATEYRERSDQDKSIHGSARIDKTGLSYPAGMSPSLPDFNFGDQAVAVEKFDNVAFVAEKTSVAYDVISGVNKGGMNKRDKYEVDFKSDRFFTPQPLESSHTVPMTPDIKRPLPNTLKTLFTPQLHHPRTFIQFGSTSRDSSTTDINAISSPVTSDPPQHKLRGNTSTSAEEKSNEVSDIFKQDRSASLAVCKMVEEGSITAVESEAPRRYFWDMESKVDKEHGVLRVTTDGHLGGKVISEDTGDIIELNMPDDAAQKYYAETSKLAIVKPINAPEAKNGGTGVDNPRARKPVRRVIKNWMTGSTRPPRDEPLKIFEADHSPPGRSNFEEMVKTRRHQGGTEVQYTMQKIIKRFWGAEVTRRFGEDWVDRSDADETHMRELEDFVLSLTFDKSTTQEHN